MSQTKVVCLPFEVQESPLPGKSPSQCENCLKFYKALKPHMTQCLKKGGSFNCNDCNRVFLHNHRLMEHVVSEHGGKPEISCCEVCGKRFQRRETFLNHRKTHEGLVFYCDICEKAYNSKRQLKDHIRHIHGPKSKCDICQKRVCVKGISKETPKGNPQCVNIFYL